MKILKTRVPVLAPGRHEAIKAQIRDEIAVMQGYGLALAGTGTVIGLAAAARLMRLMKSVLLGISPVDLLIYIAIPLVVVAAAVLASSACMPSGSIGSGRDAPGGVVVGVGEGAGIKRIDPTTRD